MCKIEDILYINLIFLLEIGNTPPLHNFNARTPHSISWNTCVVSEYILGITALSIFQLA
jgi:hypothetical protein